MFGKETDAQVGGLVTPRRWIARCSLAGMAMVAGLAACSSGVSAKSALSVRAVRTHLLAIPQLTGGKAGWCIEELGRKGCVFQQVSRGPLVATSWFGRPEPLGRNNPIHDEGLALTTSDVRAVSVAGRIIPTRAEPGLPSGLRVAAVEVQGLRGRKVAVPPLFAGHKPIEIVASFPQFVPLGPSRHRIAQRPEAGASVFVEAPGQSWERPQISPSGVCRLGMVHVVGLIASAGFVVSHVPPFSALKSQPLSLLGEPLLSCASNSYTLAGSPLVGSVLIDALHPGVEPASLRAMKPVYRYPGIFEAFGSNGAMLARRIPGAWLVVSGGDGEPQRLLVIRNLRATVDLPTVG